jgi:hypothetical protein
MGQRRQRVADASTAGQNTIGGIFESRDGERGLVPDCCGKMFPEHMAAGLIAASDSEFCAPSVRDFEAGRLLGNPRVIKRHDCPSCFVSSATGGRYTRCSRSSPGQPA